LKITHLQTAKNLRKGPFRGCASSQLVPLILLLLLFLEGTGLAARNVILMIGDGMGFNQVTAARLYRGGQNSRLNLDRLPYTAIVNTSALDSLVTDSAAAATALACGEKTKNGWLATVPDGASGKYQRVVTLLERAQQRGRKTGLVTTTTMTHATPAAFAAHVPDRGKWDAIAKQYLTETQPDLLLGGGLQYFLPPGEKGSYRTKDHLVRQGVDPTEAEKDRGLLEVAKENGYRICLAREDLVPPASQKDDKVLGLFAPGHLPYELDRPANSPVPELSEMTRLALERLSQCPGGFFLMVEGGRIDHAGHQSWNDFDEDGQGGPDDPEDRQHALRKNIAETLAFDRAIAEVLSWMEDRQDTLLLVTADHETGGLVVHAPGGENPSGSILPLASWTTNGHTPSNVPAYAAGAGAEQLHGYLDNTDIFRLLAASLTVQEATP